jgi:hypothetical protein
MYITDIRSTQNIAPPALGGLQFVGFDAECKQVRDRGYEHFNANYKVLSKYIF